MKPEKILFGVAVVLVCVAHAYSLAWGQTADQLVKQGEALHAEGKIDEALALYDKALEKNIRHQQAWYRSALAYYDIGNYQEARKGFKGVLSMYPDDMRAVVLLGRCELTLGNPEEARRSLYRALEHYPKDLTILVSVAQAEYLCGNHFAGQKYFEKALSLDPNNRDLINMVSDIKEANQRLLKEEKAEKRLRILSVFNKVLAETRAAEDAAEAAEMRELSKKLAVAEAGRSIVNIWQKIHQSQENYVRFR